MRTIINIIELDRFQLICKFENNVEKKINLLPYADSEVFKFLKDEKVNYTLINQKKYIEWLPFEVDLSADTLWHIGIV